MSEVDERSSAISSPVAADDAKGDGTRSPWPLLLAGLLLAGAVVVAGLIINNDSPTTTDPVQIAEQLIAALDEHDAEGVRNLLAEDATVAGDWDLRLDNLETMIEFDRVIGFSYDVDVCSEASPSFARCTYFISNDLTEALDVGPYSGGLFEVTSEDGKITVLLNIEENRDTMFEEAGQPFMAWVAETDPEASLIMDGELTPEALALWEEYVDEFVSSVGSG